MFTRARIRRPLLMLVTLFMLMGLAPIGAAERAFACSCQDLFNAGYWYKQSDSALQSTINSSSRLSASTVSVDNQHVGNAAAARALLGGSASLYDQHLMAAELNVAKTSALLGTLYHGMPIRDLLNEAEAHANQHSTDTNALYYRAVLYVGGDGYGSGTCELGTPASTPTPVSTTVPPVATNTTVPTCNSSTMYQGVQVTERLTLIDGGARIEVKLYNSDACGQLVGLATYKRFSGDNPGGAPPVYNQELKDSMSATLAPKQSVTLSAALPPCAYQADAFYGPVIQKLSYPGSLYGTLKRLDSTSTSGSYCANTPATATATNVPATATATNVPATATKTNIPATTTSTNVPATATATNVPATVTSTNVPATATNIPATATATNVPATATSAPASTSTNVPAPTNTTAPAPTNTTAPAPANTATNTPVPLVSASANTPVPTTNAGLNVIRNLVAPSPTATAYARVLAARSRVVTKTRYVTKTRVVTKTRYVTKPRYVTTARYHDITRVRTVTRTQVAVKTIVRYHDVTRVRVVTRVSTVVNHKMVVKTVVRYRDIVRVHNRVVVTHKTVISSVAAYRYVHHPKTGRFAGPTQAWHGALPAAEARISVARLNIWGAPVWSRSFVANSDGSLAYDIVPAFGVTRFADSAAPGQPGLSLMSGHDDIYGSIFRYLGTLHVGDTVVVTRGTHTYRYVVRSVNVVTPDDVRLLNATYTRPTLALISCTPYWVDTHRVVVIAELQ